VRLARREDGQNTKNLGHFGKSNCLLLCHVPIDLPNELHGPHLMVDQQESRVLRGKRLHGYFLSSVL